MGDYLIYLRNLVRHLNQALEDEGVDPGVRQRVVNRLMVGTPEPDTGEDVDQDDTDADPWPPSFDDLRPGAVFLLMGDDSNSGPGWPVAEAGPTNPPMNAGGF